MNRITQVCAALAALLIVIFTGTMRAQSTTAPANDQVELERQFQETMTGAMLIGFSTDSRKPDAQPREDKYAIDRATKLPGGDLWVLAARFRYGGKEISVPLVIPVKWAGDTPVMSVTDLSIPGGGTYTARVLIYRNQYVGTWQGKTAGGHLWGRIERAAAAGPATKPTSKDSN